MKKAILFDIDGVLVDVSNSYRQAIAQTTEFFTNKVVLPNEIQELKQQTGYNNDWDLTEALIKKREVIVSKEKIIEKFQELYLGSNTQKGLIENESWLLDKKIIESLSENYLLGIVTGRPREEALIPLKKERVEKYFKTIIAMEDCKGKGKPNPFGIKLALKQLKPKNSTGAIYVGDALDDIRAAKSAGIVGVGCLPPKNKSSELKNVMIEVGASQVINEVNEILKVI